MRIIAGAYKGRILKTIQGQGYRPAMSRVRESLFSMLEARGLLPIDAYVLDLYAASGSLGFECLSRGARHCTFLELDKKACQTLVANANLLEIPEKCSIVQEDVQKFLTIKAKNKFAAIFVDPPYRENKVLPTITNILKRGFLEDDGILVAEIESFFKFDAENISPELSLISDKTYGQTRIVTWKKEK